MFKVTSLQDTPVQELTAYDEIIIETFKLVEHYPLLFGGDLFFTKLHIEDIVRESRHQIRNIPDIKYTYDARRAFPPYIRDKGHYAILGMGKGKYCFIRLNQPNLIPIEPDRSIPFEDEAPLLVKEVLGNDEQATFSIINYNDLLTKFLGFKVYQVQNHERTTLSIGQVEIDSIYVGKKDDTKVIVPISGKGGNDFLSYTQAAVLNIFAKEKYPNYQCISLGVKAEKDSINIIQFSDQINIAEIKIVDSAKFIKIPRNTRHNNS